MVFISVTTFITVLRAISRKMGFRNTFLQSTLIKQPDIQLISINLKGKIDQSDQKLIRININNKTYFRLNAYNTWDSGSISYLMKKI